MRECSQKEPEKYKERLLDLNRRMCVCKRDEGMLREAECGVKIHRANKEEKRVCGVERRK